MKLKESGIFLAWCNLLRHYVSGFQYAILQFCGSRLIQVQVRCFTVKLKI